ncbi:hypothetical protein [Burkholderia cepacia]|uniref:hypothetical protein n=2 Tax=Burkholderiaceae TaxID=119060 RepID=UPI002AAFB220|nr:hypothetical protein [Burkholderia cepacia]
MATPGSSGSRCRRWMIYSPIVEIIGAGAMHSALSVSEHVFQSRIGADNDKMKTMKPENRMLPAQRVALPRQIRRHAFAASAAIASAFPPGYGGRYR